MHVAADVCDEEAKKACAAANKRSCASGSAACGGCLDGFTAKGKSGACTGLNSDALACKYGFHIRHDASVKGYTEAKKGGVGIGTLEDCYQKCTSGDWENCAGFSRYISSSDDDKTQKCWWVVGEDQFIMDDSNSNEFLYINRDGEGESVCTGTALADRFFKETDGSITGLSRIGAGRRC